MNWARNRIVQAATGIVISFAITAIVGVGGKALGATAAAFAKRQITQAGIQRAKDWYAKNVKYRANAVSPGGVPFDSRGWPRFDKWLYSGPGVKNTVRIPLTGSRRKDFEFADKKAGISEAWRKENGYTWHHHQDLGKMQLVKSSVHNPGLGGVNHPGGVAIFEQLYNVKYKK